MSAADSNSRPRKVARTKDATNDDFCNRVLEQVGPVLAADHSAPGVAADAIAAKLVQVIKEHDHLSGDHMFNLAAFADRLHPRALPYQNFSSWALPDNLYMMTLSDLRTKTSKEIEDLLTDMQPLDAYKKQNGEIALTGVVSKLLINLCRSVQFNGGRDMLSNIRTEDLACIQPGGAVQQTEGGIFVSPESEQLASMRGIRNALRDDTTAVLFVQSELGASVLNQALDEEGARFVPMPPALLEQHGVKKNQMNFSSAGAENATFGIFCAEVPGCAPKLIVIMESSGWALSSFNPDLVHSLACMMGTIQFVRSVGNAKPLPNDHLLRFVAQAVPGGQSIQLTNAANEAFGLRADDCYVSPAVQRGKDNMAAMAARPPPPGAAKKADGSDPTSAADAMRSKGGTKSRGGGAPLGSQNAKGHQNAKGRRTSVRKCRICGKEGHFTKTCSKSKEITSFFKPT
jgi:hypothetical protein